MLETARLHGLYIGVGKFCPVFPPAPLVCESQLCPSGFEPRRVLVRHVLEGDAVDILFLMVFGVFLLLALGLVAGCAALERKQ
jgi:hypothetical protein